VAAGNLPTSGPVSFGATAAADSSLNNFVNVKRITATNTANTSLSSLIYYFENYVKPPGDPSNVLVPGPPYAISETRNLEIMIFRVSIKNESASTYGNNDDAGVYVQVLTPAGRNYNLSCTGLGSTTVAASATYLFGGYSGAWDAGATKTVTIQDATTLATMTINITPAYSTGQSYSTSTSTVAAPAGTIYNTVNPSVAGSNYQTFYSGKLDPSGRPNG